MKIQLKTLSLNFPSPKTNGFQLNFFSFVETGNLKFTKDLGTDVEHLSRAHISGAKPRV
jgi:hypothetical protein